MNISSNYDYSDRYSQYNNQNSSQTNLVHGKRKHRNELDSLVQAGTITADLEKAIKE